MAANQLQPVKKSSRRLAESSTAIAETDRHLFPRLLRLGDARTGDPEKSPAHVEDDEQAERIHIQRQPFPMAQHKEQRRKNEHDHDHVQQDLVTSVRTCNQKSPAQIASGIVFLSRQDYLMRPAS